VEGIGCSAFEILPHYLPECTEYSHEKRVRIGGPGQHLNLGSAYESVMLHSCLKCSVYCEIYSSISMWKLIYVNDEF
jgi:hypothetical protein